MGSWSDDEYPAFSTERPLVELCDHAIEVLPMPIDGHQRVLDALFLIMATHGRAMARRPSKQPRSPSTTPCRRFPSQRSPTDSF